MTSLIFLLDVEGISSADSISFEIGWYSIKSECNKSIRI